MKIVAIDRDQGYLIVTTEMKFLWLFKIRSYWIGNEDPRKRVWLDYRRKCAPANRIISLYLNRAVAEKAGLDLLTIKRMPS